MKVDRLAAGAVDLGDHPTSIATLHDEAISERYGSES